MSGVCHSGNRCRLSALGLHSLESVNSTLTRFPPAACSGCDGGDRPVYSLQWAAAAGVPTEKDYPYPLPAATGICNPKVTKMKRAYTGGAVEVDLTSSQALFKVCIARVPCDQHRNMPAF